MSSTILHGDCLEHLRAMESDSVDALVTDPPAGISFMGKAWDGDRGGRAEWVAWLASVMRECLRVMKPGAHGLVWALPRTSHWTACALEDAGFEIRDCVYHVFGQGFPKSMDISKAIDKAAGAEREVLDSYKRSGRSGGILGKETEIVRDITAPATEDAKRWAGWGTALKPAVECWWLVRKPLSEKNVAANVLKWGTGGLNIDGGRISGDGLKAMEIKCGFGSKEGEHFGGGKRRNQEGLQYDPSKGRFPSHLILGCACAPDHSGEVVQHELDCAVRMLDEQSGTLKSGTSPARRPSGMGYHGSGPQEGVEQRPANDGGASRFFYCAKISASERNAGLEGMPDVEAGIGDERPSGQSMSRLDGRPPRVVKNHHPTVKPQKLMRYLCRLVTPPGGLVLDPFAGSGSTGLAALSEGFRFVGVEREEEYVEIGKRRIFSAFPEFVKEYAK